MRFGLTPQESGYVVFVEGPRLGQVIREGANWRWRLETPVVVEGVASDIDDAQAAMHARYFQEIQKRWAR